MAAPHGTAGPAGTARPARVPPWWLVGVAVVLGVAVAVDVLAGGFLTSWDHAVSRVMGRWGVRHDPWPMRLTYLLTLPGQRGTVLLVTLPTIAWLSRRARSVAPALRYALGLVLLTAAVYALKAATGRSAPPVDGLHTAAGASFPSGHVANAIIVWGTVAFCAVRVDGAPDWLVRATRIVWWAAPWSVFVGMTILNYHWQTDFVVGACVGVVVLRVVELPAWDLPAAALDRVVWRRSPHPG